MTSQQRKIIGGTAKLAILRQHLVEKVPISDWCDPGWESVIFAERAPKLEAARDQRRASCRKPISATRTGEESSRSVQRGGNERGRVASAAPWINL
jgi:hypothetical protein